MRVYGRQIKGNKTVKLDSLLSLMEFARDKISWEYFLNFFLRIYDPRFLMSLFGTDIGMMEIIESLGKEK